MAIKLRKNSLSVIQQAPITVYFEQEIVGEYFADLLVENKVVVELKAVSELQPVHEVQLVHYLKATSVRIGLLINFGEKIQIKRRIL